MTQYHAYLNIADLVHNIQIILELFEEIIIYLN
jgi:hypothetical protein